MKGKDILSVKEIDKAQILQILAVAQKMKQKPAEALLKGKVMASCFFEPSTRTRLSFESAMKRLGGEVIGFSEPKATAVQKGESLHDSIKVVGLYSDVVVIRHPLEGAAREAAEATQKPVINAGDGANEHPTQTLLDLFSIQECQGTLEGLHIALAGDLLYGRAMHSLVHALCHFKTRLYFVSPQALAMPDAICAQLRQHGVPFSCHATLDEVIDKCDILYMGRIQKERFTNPELYERVKDLYKVDLNLLSKGKKNLRVLHPLPRLQEIERAVDATKYAYYFSQAENGLYVRQALLAMLLGVL